MTGVSWPWWRKGRSGEDVSGLTQVFAMKEGLTGARSVDAGDGHGRPERTLVEGSRARDGGSGDGCGLISRGFFVFAWRPLIPTGLAGATEMLAHAGDFNVLSTHGALDGGQEARGVYSHHDGRVNGRGKQMVRSCWRWSMDECVSTWCVVSAPSRCAVATPATRK